MLQSVKKLKQLEITSSFNSTAISEDNPIVYPGFILYHGLSGTGKSYSITKMLGEPEFFDEIVYLDLEKNPDTLKSYAENYNVTYLKPELDQEQVLEVIEEIAREAYNTNIKLALVLDSFSVAFYEDVSNTHKIDEIFSSIKNIVAKYPITLVLIDHSTKHRGAGFTTIDIRGGDNKRKFVDMSLFIAKSMLPNIIVKVEKSRCIDISKNQEFDIKLFENKEDIEKQWKKLAEKYKEKGNYREFTDSLSKKQKELLKGMTKEEVVKKLEDILP